MGTVLTIIPPAHTRHSEASLQPPPRAANKGGAQPRSLFRVCPGTSEAGQGYRHTEAVRRADSGSDLSMSLAPPMSVAQIDVLAVIDEFKKESRWGLSLVSCEAIVCLVSLHTICIPAAVDVSSRQKE